MNKKKSAKRKLNSIKTSRVAQTASASSSKPAQKDPKKKASKRVSLIASASVLVLLLCGLLTFLLWPRGTCIAFYDVDPVLAEQIRPVILNWAKTEKITLHVQTEQLASLDNKTLSSVDAVVLYPSIINRQSANQFATVPPAKLSALSLPLRNSLETQGFAWIVPLLANTQEIAWNKDFFDDASMQNVSLLTLAQHLKKQGAKTNLAPVIAIGGNDKQLLDLIGILVLEKGGGSAYESLVQAIYNLQNTPDAIEELCKRNFGGFTLVDVFKILIDMQKSGQLHPNWLQINQQDLQSFFNLSADTDKEQKNSFAPKIALQSLSHRRQLPYQSLSLWSSTVHTADSKNGYPIVTASLLSIAKTQTSKKIKEFETLTAWLLSPAGQAELEKSTRLAPVTSGARTADIQASAARAAISSGNLSQGLSLDAFARDTDRAHFAEAIRAQLQGR